LPTMVRVVSFMLFTPVLYVLHLSGETPHL